MTNNSDEKKIIYKKWWFWVIAILVIILVGLFLQNVNNLQTANISVQSKIQEKMTAEEICNKLKEKGLNIGKIVVYTEETDLNNLLGRPNQYTSKVTFEDTRLEQVNLNNEFITEEERNEPTGGTIEVFENKTNMENRKNYVESISNSISMFSEYTYSNDYALLRLEHDLTPAQAKEYEEAFNNIMNVK